MTCPSRGRPTTSAWIASPASARPVTIATWRGRVGAAEDRIALITANATARELTDGERLDQYEALKRSMPDEVSVTPASVTTFLTLNLSSPKFADARVRRLRRHRERPQAGAVLRVGEGLQTSGDLRGA